jgi:glutamate synthase domain-containing protein 3
MIALVLNKEKLLSEVNVKLLSRAKVENEVWKIDADGMHYKDLNSLLKAISTGGAEKIEVRNVFGQRYIGTDLDREVQIDIYGTPGNDLGAFMNGPRLVVHGNAQDGCGNTMNEGQIVIYGNAGDITGNSMRGGRLFIRDDVGYRVGIHMKEFQGKKPQLVIGGAAQDFLGEYMAGGVILVLGLTLPEGEHCKARFVGTGMHGGVIYERGDILEVGEGTKVLKVGKRDARVIESLTRDFCSYFGCDYEKIMGARFRKIVPVSKRPYESMYSQ